MPIPFACSGCGFQTQVKDALAGRKIKCPKCGAAGVIAAKGVTPAEQKESNDDLLNVNLDTFQDVQSEDGEELPENIRPQAGVKKKKKKKSKKVQGAPLSGAVTGAAVGFSLLSAGVIALLVMFVLPPAMEALTREPAPAAEKKPEAAEQK